MTDLHRIKPPPKQIREILFGIDCALARAECRKQLEIAHVRWMKGSQDWYRFELVRERLDKARRKLWGRHVKRELSQ